MARFKKIPIIRLSPKLMAGLLQKCFGQLHKLKQGSWWKGL